MASKANKAAVAASKAAAAAAEAARKAQAQAASAHPAVQAALAEAEARKAAITAEVAELRELERTLRKAGKVATPNTAAAGRATDAAATTGKLVHECPSKYADDPELAKAWAGGAKAKAGKECPYVGGKGKLTLEQRKGAWLAGYAHTHTG